MAHYIYIVECSDHSFYTGSTSNIEKRLKAHNSGKGARWTAARRPVKLVYSESHKNKAKALKRERQLKGWTRAKKEALINNDMKLLKKLSKSYSDKNNSLNKL